MTIPPRKLKRELVAGYLKAKTYRNSANDFLLDYRELACMPRICFGVATGKTDKTDVEEKERFEKIFSKRNSFEKMLKKEI